jgi:hypothetical protein
MNYNDWVKTFENRTPEHLRGIVNAIDTLERDADILREFDGSGLFTGFCIRRAAKEALKKKTGIDCPHCFAHIEHVEAIEERHGVMSIGGEIEYDLNSDNNGSPRYFCPKCQDEIEESVLHPEPSAIECARKERRDMELSGCQ